VKMLLQSGSSYMANDGLLAAGAGNANLWSSRQLQANGGQSLVSTVVGGLADQPGGLSFSDSGTIPDRMYAGLGIRLLSLLDLPGILGNPAQASGTLNMIGLKNPFSVFAPRRLLYGDLSYRTATDHIAWGDDITSADGQHIVWGDTSTSDHIVWGDTPTTGNAPIVKTNAPTSGKPRIVKGNAPTSGDTHIVWGDTSMSGDSHIVWGDTSMTGDSHIVWGDGVMGPDAH
jgi:hypothetical protein